ncbi:MAG: CDP-alcohol phosphatidyltransferase family protein [Actinomycetota bacterium]|nr:CDP-alcohol phosphatidyltransferase family protein [Actinomycetota bacterium]
MSDPFGSWIAAIAIRFRIQASILTLADLLFALSATAVVIAQVDQAHPWWLPGLIALVLWQLAYVLDCADGQVARATGKQSDFGARVDVLVDFLVHGAIICSLITVIARWSDPPAALLAACAALWPVNLLIGVLARTDRNIGHSFTQRGRIVTVIKLVRDTGFILFATGVWLLIAPRSIIFPVVAITAFNAFFLLASIGREAYFSMRLTCQRVDCTKPDREV